MLQQEKRRQRTYSSDNDEEEISQASPADKLITDENKDICTPGAASVGIHVELLEGPYFTMNEDMDVSDAPFEKVVTKKSKARRAKQKQKKENFSAAKKDYLNGTKETDKTKTDKPNKIETVPKVADFVESSVDKSDNWSSLFKLNEQITKPTIDVTDNNSNIKNATTCEHEISVDEIQPKNNQPPVSSENLSSPIRKKRKKPKAQPLFRWIKADMMQTNKKIEEENTDDLKIETDTAVQQEFLKEIPLDVVKEFMPQYVELAITAKSQDLSLNEKISDKAAGDVKLKIPISLSHALDEVMNLESHDDCTNQLNVKVDGWTTGKDGGSKEIPAEEKNASAKSSLHELVPGEPTDVKYYSQNDLSQETDGETTLSTPPNTPPNIAVQSNEETVPMCEDVKCETSSETALSLDKSGPEKLQEKVVNSYSNLAAGEPRVNTSTKQMYSVTGNDKPTATTVEHDQGDLHDLKMNRGKCNRANSKVKKYCSKMMKQLNLTSAESLDKQDPAVVAISDNCSAERSNNNRKEMLDVKNCMEDFNHEAKEERIEHNAEDTFNQENSDLHNLACANKQSQNESIKVEYVLCSQSSLDNKSIDTVKALSCKLNTTQSNNTSLEEQSPKSEESKPGLVDPTEVENVEPSTGMTNPFLTPASSDTSPGADRRTSMGLKNLRPPSAESVEFAVLTPDTPETSPRNPNLKGTIWSQLNPKWIGTGIFDAHGYDPLTEVVTAQREMAINSTCFHKPLYERTGAVVNRNQATRYSTSPVSPIDPADVKARGLLPRGVGLDSDESLTEQKNTSIGDGPGNSPCLHNSFTSPDAGMCHEESYMTKETAADLSWTQYYLESKAFEENLQNLKTSIYEEEQWQSDPESQISPVLPPSREHSLGECYPCGRYTSSKEGSPVTQSPRDGYATGFYLSPRDRSPPFTAGQRYFDVGIKWEPRSYRWRELFHKLCSLPPEKLQSKGLLILPVETEDFLVSKG